MKMYIIAIAVGLLVGIIYGVLNVRSPAPPIVALVGLLGILVGEQIPPLVKKMISEQTVSLSVIKETCANHMFGALPERHVETDKNDHNPPKTVG
ncbi:MAG: XapX domain-containing protein [Alphaproteobacteria bacterium]|nr:XapX domain-containing protein [Alphaproteobacteria bacterium]